MNIFYTVIGASVFVAMIDTVIQRVRHDRELSGKPPIKFRNPFNDPKIVAKTPIITTLLLEFANVGQIYRMWTTHTAAGQNIYSWLMVNAALLLFLNFYRVNDKDGSMMFAILGTLFGILMNLGVVFTILYFRYGVGHV